MRLRQTVLDATDPRGLAEFWRAVLGWRYRRGDAESGPQQLHLELTVEDSERLDLEHTRLLGRGPSFSGIGAMIRKSRFASTPIPPGTRSVSSWVDGVSHTIEHVFA